MRGVRVILDFPGTGRNRDRLVFGAPIRVHIADTIAAVRPALRDAERAARAGSWVVGHLAYEAAPAFDPAFATRPHTGPPPLLWLGEFEPPTVAARPARAAPIPGPAWEPDVTRRQYDDSVARIREAIAAGGVYQVNHTFRMRAAGDIRASALYDALVASAHGKYCALIETPAWAIVSASPELFFDVSGRTITTRPMKGTARRARWPEEDSRAMQSLAASAKDRAENLMIVDLVRNDLGRFAQFGSVAVTDMFAVETYPTVHQMTSTITARLRDHVSFDDIFAALFPCGSVTGAPKIAAMRHIAELEAAPRGAYCGAIGVLRPDGSATFNVAIRTVTIDTTAHTSSYGAGGGITWDSRAAAEYDEAISKAAALTEQLPDFSLLETMRLEDGVVLRRDRHLARLRASAAYWGFDVRVVEHADAALERECGAAPAGAWRLRLTAARDGSIDIGRTPLETRTGSITAPDPADATRHVALAPEPVHSRERLLYHKTTARTMYDRHRAHCPDAFDVLLCNEHGCITEFTNGNVVVEIDGRLTTPPREAGLLAGTFRSQLLDAGIIAEGNVRIDELRRATRMWLINSVRGWVSVHVTSDATAAEPRRPAGAATADV